MAGIPIPFRPDAEGRPTIPPPIFTLSGNQQKVFTHVLDTYHDFGDKITGEFQPYYENDLMDIGSENGFIKGDGLKFDNFDQMQKALYGIDTAIDRDAYIANIMPLIYKYSKAYVYPVAKAAKKAAGAAEEDDGGEEPDIPRYHFRTGEWIEPLKAITAGIGSLPAAFGIFIDYSDMVVARVSPRGQKAGGNIIHNKQTGGKNQKTALDWYKEEPQERKNLLGDAIANYLFKEKVPAPHSYKSPIEVYTDGIPFLFGYTISGNPNYIKCVSQATLSDPYFASIGPTDRIHFVSNGVAGSDFVSNINIFTMNCFKGRVRIISRDQGMNESVPFRFNTIVQEKDAAEAWQDIAVIPSYAGVAPDLESLKGASIKVLAIGFKHVVGRRVAIGTVGPALLANPEFQEAYKTVFNDANNLTIADINRDAKIYLTILIEYAKNDVWGDGAADVQTYSQMVNDPSIIEKMLKKIGESSDKGMYGKQNHLLACSNLNTKFKADVASILFDKVFGKYSKTVLSNIPNDNMIPLIKEMCKTVRGLQILIACPGLLLDFKRKGDGEQLMAAYMRHLRGYKVIFVSGDRPLIAFALQLGMHVVRDWISKFCVYMGKNTGQPRDAPNGLMPGLWGRVAAPATAPAYLVLPDGFQIEVPFIDPSTGTNKLINGPEDEIAFFNANPIDLHGGGERALLPPIPDIIDPVVPVITTFGPPESLGGGGQRGGNSDVFFNNLLDLCKSVSPYVKCNIKSWGVLVKMGLRNLQHRMAILFKTVTGPISKMDFSQLYDIKSNLAYLNDFVLPEWAENVKGFYKIQAGIEDDTTPVPIPPEFNDFNSKQWIWNRNADLSVAIKNLPIAAQLLNFVEENVGTDDRKTDILVAYPDDIEDQMWNLKMRFINGVIQMKETGGTIDENGMKLLTGRAGASPYSPFLSLEIYVLMQPLANLYKDIDVATILAPFPPPPTNKVEFEALGGDLQEALRTLCINMADLLITNTYATINLTDETLLERRKIIFSRLGQAVMYSSEHIDSESVTDELLTYVIRMVDGGRTLPTPPPPESNWQPHHFKSEYIALNGAWSSRSRDTLPYGLLAYAISVAITNLTPSAHDIAMVTYMRQLYDQYKKDKIDQAENDTKDIERLFATNYAVIKDLHINVTKVVFAIGKYIQTTFFPEFAANLGGYLNFLKDIALEAERKTIKEYGRKYYWTIFVALAIANEIFQGFVQTGLSALSYIYLESEDESAKIRNRNINIAEIPIIIHSQYDKLTTLLHTTFTGGRRRKNKTYSKKYSKKQSKKQSKRQSKKRVKKFKTQRKRKFESSSTKK
jgi:hypothetical protein